MNSNFKNCRFTRASLVSAVIYSMRAIYVDIGYDASVPIGYNINSLESFNPAPSTDLSDLAASGLFQQFIGNNVFAMNNSGGVLTVLDSRQTSGLPVNSFSNIFNGSSAAYGNINSVQNGLFNLYFDNTDDYNMDITMNNMLDAVIDDFNSSGPQMNFLDADENNKENQYDTESAGFSGFTYEMILYVSFAVVGAVMVRHFSKT
ncbi:MAG: hypothetical protein PHW13_03280 [Methylococcales bacterium]|nr:hypothetical protein [Methylococcales bacterium]